MKTLSLGSINRLLLFGGGELTVALAAWCRERSIPVGVLTSPRHAADPLPASGAPLPAVLASLQVPTVVTDDVDSPDALGLIAAADIRTTCCLSIGAAWIFRRPFIDAKLGGLLLNLHGSRLPQNRGGGGFSWQILTGNRLGFCALHMVDDGVDTGDIVAIREFIYPASCRTPADYMHRYREETLRFVTGFVETLRAGSHQVSLMAQPDYLSTYWPRLHSPTQAWISWEWSAFHLERFICAFDDPYCGAQTTWRGRTVRLKKAFANYQDGSFHPFQSGIVYRTNGQWLCVACREGGLVIETLVDEEGRNVLADVRVGDTFHTPAERLEARASRIAYTALGPVVR